MTSDKIISRYNYQDNKNTRKIIRNLISKRGHLFDIQSHNRLMKENFIHRKYNAAFNYGTTVTSRNIIQQQKLAACV